MVRATVRLALLAFILPLILSANSYTLKNNLLKLEVVKLIDNIANELESKTGISTYVIATNEKFDVGYNFIEYSNKFSSEMSKPYVLLVFAPNAKILEGMEQTGRVGIIPSDESIGTLYDYEDVKDAAIGVVSLNDKNSDEDKHNIAVAQAFSELADNIANTKGIELKNTIPNDTQVMVWILRFFIYFGSIFVFWIFIGRSLYERIIGVKK